MVTREHASLWVVMTTLHSPAAQVGVETVRERVPIWSQGPSKPPQAPQGPFDAAPQPAPAVTRLHIRLAIVTSAPHMPEVQV